MFILFWNGSINMSACLEAHSVLHRKMPPGTQCAWLGNASLHAHAGVKGSEGDMGVCRI